MKYLPLYTVIAVSVILTISIMGREPKKVTVYEPVAPSYIKNNLELTSDKQFIEVDQYGNVKIK